MQWTLQQVAALNSGAEVSDDDDDAGESWDGVLADESPDIEDLRYSHYST